MNKWAFLHYMYMSENNLVRIKELLISTFYANYISFLSLNCFCMGTKKKTYTKKHIKVLHSLLYVMYKTLSRFSMPVRFCKLCFSLFFSN